RTRALSPAPPRASNGGSGPPAVFSAWKASPRAISPSPFRRGSRKHRRPRGSRSPTASRAISRRQSDGGLDQRDGILQRRLPAGHRALEFGPSAVEPRELTALLRLIKEGVDQRIAGDRLQHPILEAIVARRAHIFVGEVDAGYAGIVR